MKKVSIVSEYGVKTPWDKLDEWQKKSHPYTCTLKYAGRQMTVNFFMGMAHTNEPDWKTVLGCLVSDARCYDFSTSFENFCDELGYDSDSRKAEGIYKDCEKIHHKLQKLLGDDYDEIAGYLEEHGY